MPTVATSTTKAMRYFMGISWDTQSPASACVRLPHIAEVASGNADATDESREPGIVPAPAPRAVHFEVHQPWGSFGEGQVEARERLLALANLRVQPCEVQGGHVPLLGEGREIAESNPRNRDLRVLDVLLRTGGGQRLRAALLPRELVRFSEHVDRTLHVPA